VSGSVRAKEDIARVIMLVVFLLMKCFLYCGLKAGWIMAVLFFRIGVTLSLATSMFQVLDSS
jgi:hypothetical protein